MSAEQNLVKPQNWAAIEGGTSVEDVDVTSADFEPTRVIRGVALDADGTLSIKCLDDTTATLTLNGGVVHGQMQLKAILTSGTSPTTGIHVFY